MATETTFDQAINDLDMAAGEVLKHLAGGEWPDEMPEDLPPAAQSMWRACKQIQIEMSTEDFQEYQSDRS